MRLNRLEHVLTVLAHEHHLYPANLPADIEQRSRQLAKILAREGILVLAGDVSPQLMPGHEQHLVHWVQIQVNFYRLLAEAFFPSFAGFKPPEYADRELPALVRFETENAAVTAGLAKIIIPYIALRHGQTRILDVELKGMMTLVLQDLDPANSRDHDSLIILGMQLLKQWLASPIEQIPLIEPEQPLYEELQAPPAPMPPAVGVDTPPPMPSVSPPPALAVAPPPPPNLLPELDKLTSQPAKTETQELFASKVPIFYGKKISGRSLSPLPPPPKKKKGGE